MGRQIESDSVCRSDCPEYKIGESFSIGDFSYTIVGCTDGIYEAGLLKCKKSIQSAILPEYITSNCRLVSICKDAFNRCYSLLHVTIPDSVTSIGDSAFDGCASLTSVTIPDSVTSVGYSAFCGCNALTSVNIPSSVTSIRNSAFYGCTSLTSLTIPSSVTFIDNYAFYGCTSLTSMTIPSSVTFIGYFAFSGCTSLTSLTIPSSVTSICNSAFYGCTSLTSVTIPSSVTSICNSAFYGCTSLTSVTIPSDVTTIGYSAFYGCTSLTSVTIPSGVTSIDDSAFSGCTSLTSVTIPSGVTSIDDSAFSGCTSLTSVTIPSSVTHISGSAFSNCDSLCKISVNPNNEYYLSESDVLFNKDKTELIFCSRCKKGTYLIPETVKIINCDAFNDCSELKAIVIPSNVVEIQWIEYGSVDGCYELEQIIVSENNAFYSTDDDGVLFDKEKITLFYCPDGLSGDYVVPNTVKIITSDNFKNCHRLKSITVPSSVSYNSDWGSIFYKEDGITEVEPGNFGGFRYVFNGEKFIRDSAIVKYIVDGVEHTDYIKLRKE